MLRRLLSALPLLLATCTPPAASPPAAGCIDPAKIRKDAMCTMEYAPVCGCDGRTFGNACAATNAGVQTVVPGPCAGTQPN